MESKIFGLAVLLVVLSCGTIYTEGQTTEKIDPISTTSEISSNASNATVPTTAVPTTATTANTETEKPTSTVPTTVPTTANTATVPTTTVPSTALPVTVPTSTSKVVTTEPYTKDPTGETTQVSTTTSKPCSMHGFDAASFVGGIVLGLGVCGIAFFIFKWYQSKHPSAAPYQQF